MHDLVTRGRNGRAKLDAESVREIRISEGTLKEIAARFGVFWTTISAIKKGRTWRHVK
jgi:hypothetical protein